MRTAVFGLAAPLIWRNLSAFLGSHGGCVDANRSKVLINAEIAEVRTSPNLSDFPGGLNGSTQH